MTGVGSSQLHDAARNQKTTMSTQSKTFTVGQKLSACSIGDRDCIFRATVIKRTAKRVTLDLDGKTVTVGICEYDGGEVCYPFGKFSMAPIFRSLEGDRYPAQEIPQFEDETDNQLFKFAVAFFGVNDAIKMAKETGLGGPSNVIPFRRIA